MKKIMLGVALLVATVSMAQNSLFSNISTTDQYQRYFYVQDKDGDGFYEIKDRDLTVKFNIKTLPTGEGYRCEAVIDEGGEKGKVLKKMDALEGYSTCVGYPYESNMRHKHSKDGFISIGDYVFLIYNMSEDGVSFDGILAVFIKKSTSSAKTTNGKKKKLSFKEKMKALKNASSASPSYGPAHKELQSKNLDKYITDYLVAMKAKQNGRTAAEKLRDKNLENAKGKSAADLKAYNDSIRASPEYQDLQRRKRQNEANYQASKTKNKVTLRNNSGSDVYVGTSGSRNPGTRISAGGTASWSCDRDAYFQTITKSGGSNAYRSTSRKAYSANSGCGKTLNIN